MLHFGKNINLERDIEAEAMKFAAEFLVPQLEFVNMVVKFDLQSLANQKRYWMVSMGAILFRGKELKLLNENQYRYLWQQMAALGYKRNEPEEIAVPREKPSLLQEILEMHLRDLKYTKEQLAEMLHINMNDLLSYFYPDNYRLRVLKN